MAKKKYTCPYCFHQFAKDEMVIRTSPNGKIKYRYCPNPDEDINGEICDSYLPADFTDHDSKTIAIYGGTNAGKSTYIASVVKMLIDNHDAIKHLKLHTSFLEEDEHSEELIDEYWERMVLEERFPDFSSATDRRLKKPIVLSIQNILNGKRIYLTFFDTPGIEFDKVKDIAEYHPHIVHANAILFFLDPLQIKSMLSLILENDSMSEKYRFRDYIPVDRIRVEQVVKNLSSAIRTNYESSKVENKSDTTVDNSRYKLVKENIDIQNIIDRYLKGAKSNLGVKNRKKSFSINIPTAFCISKYDLLAGTGGVYGFNNLIYSDDQLFVSNTPNNGWINFIKEKIDEESKVMYDFLSENETKLFYEISSHFSRYKMLGVAAALADDKQIEKVKLRYGKPVTKNLLYPLIWVLDELKFFK